MLITAHLRRSEGNPGPNEGYVLTEGNTWCERSNMLGERAAPWIEVPEPVIVTPTSKWKKRSKETISDQPADLSSFRLGDRTVAAANLYSSPDIIDSLRVCQRTVCPSYLSPEAKYLITKGKAFETILSRNSSPYRVGKRPYNVMSFAGESQHPSAGVNRRVGYPPMVYEDDVQLQKDEEEGQAQQANQAENARYSVSELSPEYFSGDSDLTAEPMAEGSSSRCSSLEEGCTLNLEATKNKAERLSEGLETGDQRHKHSDSAACRARIHSAERHMSPPKESGNGDRPDEKQPLNFPTCTPVAEVSKCPKAAQFMQLSGANDVVSTCANPTSAAESAPHEIANTDESWLQLRLGQTNSESFLSTGATSRQKSVPVCAESDPSQDALETLQLLPPKTEQYSTDQCSEDGPKEPELRGDMLIPAIPSTIASYAIVDRNSMYINEVPSARWASPSEFQVPIQSFAAPAQATAAPFTSLIARVEMNVDRGKRGDQSSVLNRSNETPRGFYTSRRPDWEDHQGANLARVLEAATTRQASLYPYEQQRYIGYADPSATDDWRWQKPAAAAQKSPMVSEKLQNPRLTPIPSVEAPWQGLPRRFSTSLGFQGWPELADNSLLPWIAENRRKGNSFVLEQTLDRVPSIRSQTRPLDSGHASVPIPAAAWNHSASTSSWHRRSPNKPCDVINNTLQFDGSASLMEPAAYTSRPPPPPASAARLRLAKGPASRGSVAGIWFTLEAANSQDDDQDVPPVQKMYMRISDGGITISVVKKYLASKLGLANESEVEITCKGKQLSPNFTLQHVRDKIWITFGIEEGKTFGFKSASTFSLNPKTQVMALFYQRCSHNLTLNLLKM